MEGGDVKLVELVDVRRSRVEGWPIPSFLSCFLFVFSASKSNGISSPMVQVRGKSIGD